MKIFSYIIIIALFVACKPNKHNSNISILKDSISYAEPSAIDTIKLFANRFGLKLIGKNNSFITDTFNESNFKFIVFGKIDELTFSNRVFSCRFDSIYVITPVRSKLIFDDCIYGLIYSKKTEIISGIIIISDINRDGKKDFGIKNDCLSGNGQNLTYDYWINDGHTLKFNPEFSLPNFEYINRLNEYYSRSSGGGLNRIETYYKFKKGKLKPLRSIETEGLDKVLKYTIVDLKKNDTVIKFVKNE
jgi:hypothetical protein